MQEITNNIAANTFVEGAMHAFSEVPFLSGPDKNIAEDNIKDGIIFSEFRTQPENTVEKPTTSADADADGQRAGMFDGIATKDLVKIKKAAPAHENISSYKWILNEMNRYPLLERDVEDELVKRAQAGDVDAKHLLCNCNLRMIHSLAKNYDCDTLDITDLIQEGVFGMIKAIDKYKASSGAKFTTFAYWWIRQAIGRSVAEKDKTIRLPVHIVEFVGKINNAKKKFSSEFGRSPTPAELAEILNVSEKKIVDVYGHISPVDSLNRSPLGGSDDASGKDPTIMDLISDTNSFSTEEMAEASYIREQVNIALNKMNLCPRDRYILESRFEINGRPRKTLDQLGSELGLSRERCRQIEARELSELQRILKPILWNMLEKSNRYQKKPSYSRKEKKK